MKSVDQILKIKATVLYILGRMPEGVDYIHLFKVMYFAQQEHLVKYGLPLMEDTFCARRHGPVPSLTYKVLKNAEIGGDFDEEAMREFRNALKVEVRDGIQVVTARQPYDDEELSLSDIAVLDDVIEKCRDIESFKLSDISHDKAWKTAQKTADRTGESAKIPLYDIAKAGGANQAMLDIIRERQWTEHHL